MPKMVNKPKVELLVLQSTSFCNINCKYCYLPDRKSKNVMEIGTVIKSVSNLLEADLIGSALTILWHAGEPLTIPISYYRNAFIAIREIIPESTTITHSFQTNGLLLNEEWASLINEYGLEVGVSLDGFDALHDEYRRTWNNKGTFNYVMNAIDVLKKNKIKLILFQL